MTTTRERVSLPSNFNKLQLIELIRARPALWDKTEESYRHKFMKRAAWHEICKIMLKDYDKLNGTERQKYYLWMVKAWRHTRDSWGRSVNARKKAKKIGTFMRPYKFDKAMAFLKKIKGPTVSAAAEGADMDNEEEAEDEEEGVEEEEEKFEESESDSVPLCDDNNECNDDTTNDEWNADSKEGIVTDINREKAINEIDNTFKSKNNRTNEDLIDAKIMAYLNQMQNMKKINDIEEDRHFAFFKSVHPSLISLDDDQILDFQSGVINILRNIKRGGRFYNVTSDQACSSSSGGHYLQPETPLASQQPVVAQNLTQAFSSGTAGSSSTQLRIIVDPLQTD